MLKLANDFMNSTDEIFGLTIMFSFDYLFYTHTCICDLIKNNKISDDNLKMLKSVIF